MLALCGREMWPPMQQQALCSLQLLSAAAACGMCVVVHLCLGCTLPGCISIVLHCRTDGIHALGCGEEVLQRHFVHHCSAHRQSLLQWAPQCVSSHPSNAWSPCGVCERGRNGLASWHSWFNNLFHACVALNWSCQTASLIWPNRNVTVQLSILLLGLWSERSGILIISRTCYR